MLHRNKLRERLGQTDFATPQSHRAALRNPKRIERPILGMLTEAAKYADAYREAVSIEVGEDGYSDEYFGAILRSLVALLNCPTGRLDCATLDAALRGLAADVGLDPDTFQQPSSPNAGPRGRTAPS